MKTRRVGWFLKSFVVWKTCFSSCTYKNPWNIYSFSTVSSSSPSPSHHHHQETLHAVVNDTSNSASVIRAAEEYMQCLLQRAKQSKHKILTDSKNTKTLDATQLRIRGKQTWLLAHLKEFLQSITVDTQKYQKKKKKVCYAIIDKLGWTFADSFLSLKWQERRNMTALILADFPVSVNHTMKGKFSPDTLHIDNNPTMRTESLFVDSLQAGWSDDVASSSSSSFLQHWEEEEEDDSLQVETKWRDSNKTFDRDWQFYDIFLSGIASHCAGFQVACEWRRTLYDLCLPVNAVGVVDYFHQVMDTQSIISSAQICLNYLMRHIDIYFRRCFLSLETLDVSCMNTFTRHYRNCLSRASVLPSSSDEGDFLKRIQSPGRRVFVLLHPSALDYPLAFAEVALTKQLPSTLDQVKELELSWTDLENKRIQEPFYVILLECFPTERVSKMGLTPTMIDMMFHKLSRQFSIKTIYTQSHIRGLLSWMKKQVERQKACASSFSPLLKSASEVLSQVLLANGRPKPLEQLDRQVLEDHKEALLSICAHYLIRVRRNGGLPADSCTALHLTNGARLTDICWYSDNTSSAVGHSSLMMSRFCYHLDSKQYYAYYFASRNFVNISEKVQYWLNQLKCSSSKEELDTRV